MTPERYRQIGELYHAALEVDADERAAFLDRACAGDEEMRREVESLIASHEEAADFIAEPALAVAAGLFADSQADALTGQDGLSLQNSFADRRRRDGTGLSG